MIQLCIASCNILHCTFINVNTPRKKNTFPVTFMLFQG